MTAAVSPPIDSGLGESQLMEKYGISFNGDQYDCQGYRYSRFDDALTFAKSQVEKPNPEHTANSLPPKEKSSGTWWKILLTIFGIVVLLVVINNNRPPPTYTQVDGKWKSSDASPYEIKERDRYPIKMCWEGQAKKSNTPSEARSMAAMCEGLEASYVTKHGEKP